MAHLAFVSPPFVGHLAPASALARELAGRGHRVTFVGIADAARLLDRERFGFRPVGAATHPAGHLAAMTRRMGRASGLVGLGGILRDVAAATDMLARELPGALRAIGADLVVCDGTEAAGGLAARHLGIPLVTLAAALPLNRDPAVPPPFTGWRHDASRRGLERNAGGYRVADWLMRSHARVIADHAARLGLKGFATLEDGFSDLAQVSQLVPGLDFPRTALPAHFHYCGPLRGRGRLGQVPRAINHAPHAGSIAASSHPPHPEVPIEDRPRRTHDGPACFEGRLRRPPQHEECGGSDSQDEERADVPAAPSRPRAYATLGTLQGGRLSLFRRIAGAADRLGLDLVLSHGGALRPDQAARLPGSPDVRAWVDQREVLDGASLAIVNGGLNTVMDALAAGVPVVVLPIAFEQAAIAARLAHAGAGRAVAPRLLTSRRLARTMRAVLDDPACAAAARRLGAEVAASGGTARAADIVERVLATGRPVRPGDLASTSAAAPAAPAPAAAIPAAATPPWRRSA